MQKSNLIDFPFQIEIREECKLEYKKSYMRMLNKFAFEQGAIQKELFEKASMKIFELKK